MTATNLRVALAAMSPPNEIPKILFHNYGVHFVEAALRARDPGLDVQVVEAQDSDIEELLFRINAIDPDVLGLSSYLWSFPSLFEVARRRKQAAPDTTIVMGGPAAHVKMLELPPYRDAVDVLDAIVAKDGGEGAFAELAFLERRDPEALASVAGLIVPTRASGRRPQWTETAAAGHGKPLDALASPYQMALMPQGGMAYLRTFEGCPLACSYCEWGVQRDARNVFSAAYLTRELQAFEERGAIGALLIDAALNLNAQAFEQLAAAESRARFLRDREFICELYPSLLTGAHLRFLDRIRHPVAHMGLQSLDPGVLQRLNRPFDPALFFRVLQDVARVSPVTVEIILGLPGDNPESFRRTFERLRSLKVGVRVYHCVVLPSALMARGAGDFALVFDPVSLKVESCLGWPAPTLPREAERLSRLLISEGGAPASYWWGFGAPRHAKASPSIA